MAIYHIVINTVNRKSGHSATAKIAYNSRSKIKDIRTNEIFNYSNFKMKAELLHSEITCGDVTINNREREKIWNEAELKDNRSNSRTAREYVLALPKELTLEQNIVLVRDFAKDLTKKYGHLADWSIHNGKSGNENIHVHILTTTRQFNLLTKELGIKTDLELENGTLKSQGKAITQDQIKDIRKNWEELLNKHLNLAGHDVNVSSEKKADRIMVKKHLGKNATALERRGIKTELGNYNRTIDELLTLNRQIFSDGAKLAQARAELTMLEQQAAIEQQKQAERSQAERLHQEQLRTIAQMEISRIEQEKAKAAKKQEERAHQLELERIQEQRRQKKSIEAEELYITGRYSNPLFNVAASYGEFFTWQGGGHYSSRDGGVTIDPTRVNMHKYSDNNIKLCIDVAVVKFNAKFVLTGSDSFIKAAIEILASEPRYADVVLDNKAQQEMLESRKLDIEISNAVDLDLDSPDIELEHNNLKELKTDKLKKSELDNDYDFGL